MHSQLIKVHWFEQHKQIIVKQHNLRSDVSSIFENKSSHAIEYFIHTYPIS